MTRRLLCLSLTFLAVTFRVSAAHAQEQFPIMDKIADKVIQKYQQSSCPQLMASRNQPKSSQEQRALQMLRSDPTLRKAFIDKVAAPIANKMFECGLIP